MERLLVICRTWRWSHYAWFGSGAFVIVFAVIELRNLPVLWWFYETTHSVAATSLFAWSLMGGITTLFTPLGATLLILFAVLASANMVLLYQYVQRQRRVNKQLTMTRATHTSVAGVVAATFGIGCASCGTAILFSIATAVGASGLILWLPLHGLEFSVFGVAALGYTVWYLLGLLQINGRVCQT